MSIAESLNGTLVNYEAIKGKWSVDNLIYTFEDGSKAKQIVEFIRSEPHQTASLSTSSHLQIFRWKAINDQSKT